MTFIRSTKLKSNLPVGMLLLALISYSASNELMATTDSDKLDQAKAKSTQKSPMTAMNKEKQVELSKAHLATELTIEHGDIELAGVTSVTWRSGAMGCPKQGMMYTQALVPGVLIRLNVDGKTYRYHAASKGKPFYCPDNRAESPSNVNADM